MKTRIATIAVDSSGSASGTIGTPPGRYAGAYFRFNPSTMDPTVEISNMGRDLLTSHVSTADEFLDELDPASEKLLGGDTVISISASGEGTATVMVFMHFPT